MKLAMKLLLFLVVVLSLVGSASATEYFVKNGGNDSLNGLSDTNAWETVAKVGGFSFSTGDDVYFKCGSTWTQVTLGIDWEGTSGNQATIGAYYGDGIIGVSGDKPTFDGEYVYPTDWNNSLINIYNKDYITVENISIINIYGIGTTAAYSSNIIYSNLYIDKAYNAGLKFYEVDNSIVEYCNITDTGRKRIEDPGTNYPAALAVNSGSSYVTVRNNTVWKNYGEGIGSYHYNHDCIFEYNVCYANKVQIYICHSNYNMTIRYNLCYGTTDEGYVHGGIGINSESQDPDGLQNNVSVHHNLVAYCYRGIFLGANQVAESKIDNYFVYNNIVIDSRTYNFYNFDGPYVNSAVKNNIFWNTNESIPEAWIPSNTIDFDYNLWGKEPDVDVQGTNDLPYGAPNISKMTGWTSLVAHELNGSEFTLQLDSAAIDAGLNLGATYDDAIDPLSTWVDSITLVDQDDYGTGWELGAFVYGTAEGPAAPTTSDFGLYKIITINQTMVNQSIGTGIYPLLVSTTDTDLRDNAQADGDDIVFFDSDNTTLLPYEQEFWNSTNGELVEWVGVTDITNVTHIVMYYNNSTIANSENATGVWDSNFVVVQHLNETPAGTTYDSTSNNNDGTTVGMDSADQVAGQIDGSLDFDGTDDRISLTSLAIDNNAAFTISTWMYGEPGGIAYAEGYSGDTSWATFLGVEENSPYSARFYYKESNVWKCLTKGTSQVNDSLHHVVLTQTNKSYRTILIDSVLEDTNTDTVGDMSTLNTANIGVLERSTFDPYFTGLIDEQRISDIGRSIPWSQTEYNNTAYPALFISIGAEQGEGAPDTKFEYWSGSTWVDDEAQYYLWFTCFWHTPECANAEQSNGQATLKITNNGTASGTPKMKLNESAPAGIEIFVDDDNTFAGAVELTNTYQAVSTSLSQDTNITLWAWANLSGASAWEFETYAIVE